MDLLHYGKHFVLLVGLLCMAIVARNPVAGLGVVGSFGLFALLHAGSLVVTLQSDHGMVSRIAFAVSGSGLCMACVAIGLAMGHLGATHPILAGPACGLALASGLGAVSYLLLIQLFFRARFLPSSVFAIGVASCSACLTVLVSRLYLHGGLVWFAGSWWFAFSFGLWCRDALR